LHEEVTCFFTADHSETLLLLPVTQKLLPENNTLFGAALRTFSRLIDNGISLEVAAPLLEWFRIG